MLDAEEAHDRAEEHHPLDAEVEHARALREELAERGEEERRPVRDRRSEDDDDDAVVHGRRLGGRRRCPSRPVDRDAVADEELAAEHREQDDSLHDPDEARGEVRALQRVARVLEAAHQEGDEHHGERVVPRERRNDDARVAVVRLLQAPRVEDVAEVPHLARAADPGDRAREAEDRDDLPPRPHARVPRSSRRVRDHLRLEPEPRPGVEDPDDDRDGDAEDEAERDRDRADGPHRPRRGVGERLALREELTRRRVVAPVRLAVEDQVVEKQRGAVVEHQRGDDLVGVGEGSQQARDRGPRRPGRRADEDHRRQDHRRRLIGEVERDARGADRPEIELPLGADVEQPHAEGNGGREPRERERRRGDERVRERPVGQERRVEEPPEGRPGRVTGRQENHGDRREGDEQRAERDDDREPPALDETSLDANGGPGHRTPAISSPSSSVVAVRASRSPTIDPSYMTTIRSASTCTSSRSSLIRSTATPSAAA